MIRPGTDNDVIPCTALAAEFWTHTRYEDPFDAEHVAMMFMHCMSAKLFLVLEDPTGRVVGFVAGLSMPLLGNRHSLQVTELAFWIIPSHRGKGIRLLRAFEQAAAAIGAKYINMISLQTSMPEKVRRIYEGMGYEHSESVFTKELEAA